MLRKLVGVMIIKLIKSEFDLYIIIHCILSDIFIYILYLETSFEMGNIHTDMLIHVEGCVVVCLSKIQESGRRG